MGKCGHLKETWHVLRTSPRSTPSIGVLPVECHPRRSIIHTAGPWQGHGQMPRWRMHASFRVTMSMTMMEM